MPVLVFVRLPNVIPEQYHAHVMSVQDALGGETPQGALFHAAHTVDEADIQIVSVWESEADHQAYLESYAQPSLTALGIGDGAERHYHPVHSEIDI